MSKKEHVVWKVSTMYIRTYVHTYTVCNELYTFHTRVLHTHITTLHNTVNWGRIRWAKLLQISPNKVIHGETFAMPDI